MQSTELRHAIFDTFAYRAEYALVGLNSNYTFNYKNQSFWQITKQQPVKDFLYWVNSKYRNRVKSALTTCLQNPLETVSVDIELSVEDAKSWKIWEFIALPNTRQNTLIYGLGKYFSNDSEKQKWVHSRQLDYVIDSITDGLFIINQKGLVTRVNRALQVSLRMDEEEIVGKYFWEVFDIQSIAHLRTKLEASLYHDKTAHFEEFNKERNLWVEVNAYPFEDGLIVYLRDITERKNTEKQLKRQNEELIEIARTYSHEIRRPVASVLGLVELLSHTPLTEEQAQILNFLKTTSTELDDVIKNIVLRSYQATQPEEL